MPKGLCHCNKLVASVGEADFKAIPEKSFSNFSNFVKPLYNLTSFTSDFFASVWKNKVLKVYKRSHEKRNICPTFSQSSPRSTRHVWPSVVFESAETKLQSQITKSANSGKSYRTPSLQCYCDFCKTHDNHEHQGTLARGKYSSAESSNVSNERELRKGRKQNSYSERVTFDREIVREHKPGRRRREQKQQQQHASRCRSPSSDNSKSSLVVLYRGERRRPDSSCSSSSTTRKPQVQVLSKSSRSTSSESRVPLRSRAAEAAAAASVRRKRSSKNKEKYRREAANVVSADWIGSEQRRRILARRGYSRSAECVEILRKEKDNRDSRPRRRRRRFCPRPSKEEVEKEEDEYRRYQVDCEKKEELCPRAFDSPTEGSGRMAQRSNSQRKNLEPDLLLLVEHIQDRHCKAKGDNPDTLNIKGSQRIFPFQATPSGNLKIIPNQIVFESKKVSVLVADPRHVSVKAEQSCPERHTIDVASIARRTAVGVTTSTAERLQVQQKLSAQPYRPRTRPHNRSRACIQYQQQQQHQQQIQMQRQQKDERQQVDEKQSDSCKMLGITDVPLADLGFTSEKPINWNNITLPEKTDLYQELARRIKTYKNADCIVRIDNDEFHCHLLVLQSYSTFFDDKNVKEIDLTGSSVTSAAFSIIYDWMISPTSESCHLLRRDNILEIFLAAQHLGIKELEEQCWAFIDNDELFSEDTAFLLYLEARKIGNTAVMELMVPRIMKFFLMLVSTKDFLELAVQELCLLLRSNYISVNSEMEVLMSAVRWLMYDWEGRKQFLLEVMKCVRFGLIAPWQLVDVKRNPENPEFMELMSYPEIQKMVDDGLAFVIIKYWYGNQAEDYYHWIDLLGLTEPTNRNWAGEDKNYLTYREFLLYLEEYQKTKISEIKNKKIHSKPTPPRTPPKDDSSPQTTPLVKMRMNHQNSKVGEDHSPMSNARLSRNPTDTPSNKVPHVLPPCMMMSPEVLTQCFNSIGRNSDKPVIDDAGKCCKSGINTINVKRFSGGAEVPIKLVKVNRLSDLQKSNTAHKNTTKDEEKKCLYENEKTPQLGSKNLKKKSTLNNTVRKFQGTTYTDERQDSSKSEEEAAATTIQVVYRGYKARRKAREMRKMAAIDKHRNKKIAELLAIPSGLHLHELLEPIKVNSDSSGQEQNERKDNDNALSSYDTTGDSGIIKEEDMRIDSHLRISSNTENYQFLPQESKNNCDPNNKIEIIMAPAYFTNDEKTDTTVSSEITDPDDTLSQQNGDKLNAFESNKMENNKIEDNMKYYYSATELSKTKTKKNEMKKISKCKPLVKASTIEEAVKNSLSQEWARAVEREAVLVFGGIDPHADYGRRGNTGKDVYRYKTDENCWEFVGEMPESRHHHSVAYLTGRIYLAGGADPREDDLQRKSIALGTVWSYDPRVKNWYSEPNMLTPRQNFGLVVSDGKIFAIGGQNENGMPLKSVEAFNPVAREWKEVRSMHIARVGAATAKYEGYIWVAGGMTKSKREPLSKDVECYDSSKNVWFKVEPLRSPRCFSCLQVASNRLFIIGGAGKTSAADGSSSNSSSSSSSSVESISCVDVWDANLCAWQRQAEILTARHGHTVSSIGDQLIILGGVTTLYMKALKSTECYCSERDKWIKGISPLPFAISGHDSVSLSMSSMLAE